MDELDLSFHMTVSCHRHSCPRSATMVRIEVFIGLPRLRHGALRRHRIETTSFIATQDIFDRSTGSHQVQCLDTVHPCCWASCGLHAVEKNDYESQLVLGEATYRVTRMPIDVDGIRELGPAARVAR